MQTNDEQVIYGMLRCDATRASTHRESPRGVIDDQHTGYAHVRVKGNAGSDDCHARPIEDEGDVYPRAS